MNGTDAPHCAADRPSKAHPIRLDGMILGIGFSYNHPLADCSGPALELMRAQFSADPANVTRAVVRAKIEASRTEGVLSDEDTGLGVRKLLKVEPSTKSC